MKSKEEGIRPINNRDESKKIRRKKEVSRLTFRWHRWSSEPKCWERYVEHLIAGYLYIEHNTTYFKTLKR
ncbi:unnamed protein product [Brassica oleracea var. botrytis]|uniref:Uncharacterized protein n=1 Tax=Brassica oleracea TaxID=3712 RepID=A0A3P6FV41_BRAOL|nr:unnamed protein product [Brassica oleracea]